VLQELYAPFNRNREKIILMDVRSAELTKYAANSFLATKISFMNEMANLAELLEADIELVRKGTGADRASVTTSSTRTAATAEPVFPRMYVP